MKTLLKGYWGLVLGLAPVLAAFTTTPGNAIVNVIMQDTLPKGEDTWSQTSWSPQYQRDTMEGNKKSIKEGADLGQHGDTTIKDPVKSDSNTHSLNWDYHRNVLPVDSLNKTEIPQPESPPKP